jgi:hypothetical protein
MLALHNIYIVSLSDPKPGVRHKKSAALRVRPEETDRPRRFHVAAVSAVAYNVRSGHSAWGRVSEEIRRYEIMEIDDTIQMLVKVRQSIDSWVARTTTRPDALIADLNDLYVASTENCSLDDLFEYSDVGSPSITLRIGIDVEFDLKTVMENLRTRLHIRQPGRGDNIGNAGIVWSHGRYDFVYDDDSGALRISHRYSHKRVDTKSVSSIAKQTIDYAIDYLEEVRASVKKSAGVPETDDIQLPHEGKA